MCRPQSYVPAYFFFESGFAQLFGISIENAFGLMILISNFFLVASVFFLGRLLKFDFLRSVALFGFVGLLFFSFNNSVLSPRHVFGNALLLLIIGVFLSEKFSVFKNAVLIGLTAFWQVPIAVWGFLGVVLFKGANGSLLGDWKGVLKSFLFGALVFLLLFSPWLLKSGFPTESKSAEWGYGLAGAFDFLIMEQTPFVFAFMAAMVFIAFFEFKKWSNRLRWYFIGTLFLLGIHFWVSFRANLLLALTSGVLILHYWVPEPSKSSAVSNRFSLFIVFFVLATALAIDVSREGVVPYSQSDLDIFETLKQFSNPRDVILAEPYLGHSVAALANRKVVADLYVEFSSEKQLNDVYDFLNSANPEILDRYAVDWVLVFSGGSFASASQFVFFDSDARFGFLDKVLASDEYALFRVLKPET